MSEFWRRERDRQQAQARRPSPVPQPEYRRTERGVERFEPNDAADQRFRYEDIARKQLATRRWWAIEPGVLVQKTHVWDGSRDAGTPIGDAYLVVALADDDPFHGPFVPDYFAVLNDGQKVARRHLHLIDL